MTQLRKLIDFLEDFAPAALAAEWDNVGLLMGDAAATVERVMTCLTITPASAVEAIRERANLIVAHHPLPFRPIRRLTADSHEGRLLWELARHGIAIYSPHTAFDSTRDGINARLAAGLGLTDVRPFTPVADSAGAEPNFGSDVGNGRQGRLSAATTVAELAARVKSFLGLEVLQVGGSLERSLTRVGVTCGSAGELLVDAARSGVECLVTGEMRFHDCLQAEALGIELILTGHYASERFGVEGLADVLTAQFTELKVWPSQAESDPLRWH